MRARCDKVSESLPDFALGLLDEIEATGVRRHLAEGCSSCRQELRELEAASHLLALELPPVKPPAHLKSSLLESIASHSPPGPTTQRPPAPASENRRERFRWQAALPYLAASVCALALGWLAAQFHGQDQQVVDNSAAREQWQQQIDQAQRDLGIAATQPVDWRASASSADAAGQINIVAFDDKIARQLHLVVTGLKPLAAGARYDIWLLDASEKVLTSTSLDLSSANVATGVADAPTGSAVIHKVVVSAETADKPTKPSGQIVATANLASG